MGPVLEDLVSGSSPRISGLSPPASLRLTQGRDAPAVSEGRLSPIGLARRNREKADKRRTLSPEGPTWRKKLDSEDVFRRSRSDNAEAANRRPDPYEPEEDEKEAFKQFASMHSGFPQALLQKKDSLRPSSFPKQPASDEAGADDPRRKFMESKAFTQSMSVLPSSDKEKGSFKSPVDVLRQRRNSKSFLAPEEEAEMLPLNEIQEFAPGIVFPLIKDELYYTVMDGNLTATELSKPANAHVSKFHCVSCSCKPPSHLRSPQTEHQVPDIAIMHKFVCWLDKKIKETKAKQNSMHHYGKEYDQKKSIMVFRIPEDGAARRNFVFLLGAYLLIKTDLCTPEMAWQPFVHPGFPTDSFPVPNSGQPLSLSVLDGFRGLYKAMIKGWYDFSTFDVAQYEMLRKSEQGEMVWISPKILLMNGPADEGSKTGSQITTTQCKELLNEKDVNGVIRLCNPGYYSADKFQSVGISHFDFFIATGTTPKEDVVVKFLRACELIKGPVAIHSEQSMGRAATLAGVWLIKKEKLTGPEAIAWLRMVKPGAFVGHQAGFLTALGARTNKSQQQPDFTRSISNPNRTEVKMRPVFHPRSRTSIETSTLQARRSKMVSSIGVPKEKAARSPGAPRMRKNLKEIKNSKNFDTFIEMVSSQASEEDMDNQDLTWHGTGIKDGRRMALESKWDLEGMEDHSALERQFHSDPTFRRPASSLFRRIVGEEEEG